jgi:protein subunit release factor B
MTKVEVRFSIQEADWLTDPVKQALREKFTGKINADGEFIMTSQRHRTREDNQRDALAKLREMIDAAEAVSRGEKTKEEKKQLRIQRNKATRAKRSRQKYGAPAGEPTKAASLESTPVSHPAL